MQQYNYFWISGSAVTGPPHTDYWTPGGAVHFQRANGSLVELKRFNLESFELDDQGVAALFGLELARLVVDTSYAELLAMQRDVERLTNRTPYRRYKDGGIISTSTFPNYVEVTEWRILK